MHNIAFPPAAHRDGEFVFAAEPDGWTPCRPVEDFLLTFGTFVLAMVAPVSFIVWMVS
jgi:hypothetical protein